MNNKIIINILYWDAGEKARLDNTNLSWYYLNRMVAEAAKDDLIIEPFLFDFSEEKVLEDAIHIPYPKGEYKRSEKINKVIRHHGGYDGYFAIMDSDLIIKESDYEKFFYFIKTLKPKRFYTFGLDDVNSYNGIDFENKKIEFEKVTFEPRILEPDLGALFLIHIDALCRVGGFDESFTVYGGEDNKISYALQDLGYIKNILPMNPLHLPHESLFSKVVNTAEYKIQYEKVLASKKNYK